MWLLKPFVQVLWSARWPVIVEGSAIVDGAGAVLGAVVAGPEGVGVGVGTVFGSAKVASPSEPVREICWSDFNAAARAAPAAKRGTTRFGSAGSAPVGYCTKTILLRSRPLSASAMDTSVVGVSVSESATVASATCS